MNLLVICEPKFDSTTGWTVNLAMNEILRQYQLFHSEVHCLCPGDFKDTGLVNDGGVVFHTVNYYRGNKINKITSILKGDNFFLNEIISDFQIDIIQYRIPSFFTLGFYYCAQNIPVKKSTYIAGDMYENLVNNFYKVPFIKIIAKFSERLQDKLIKNSVCVSTGHVLAKKYEYLNKNIHPYYSTTHNDIIKSLNNGIYDVLKIVFLGRIDEAKRLVDIVDATNVLKRDNIPFEVSVIGDGPSLQNIKAKVESYGLSSSFVFYGYISNRDKIDEILTNSHVIVLASVTEGTAKVLPEAMSRGVVPIAVKDVGSNNYIIDNEKNGFLFQKYNYEELAGILKSLYQKKYDFLHIRENCYTYAKAKTASEEVRKMWEFILSVN